MESWNSQCHVTGLSANRACAETHGTLVSKKNRGENVSQICGLSYGGIQGCLHMVCSMASRQISPAHGQCDWQCGGPQYPEGARGGQGCHRGPRHGNQVLREYRSLFSPSWSHHRNMAAEVRESGSCRGGGVSLHLTLAECQLIEIPYNREELEEQEEQEEQEEEHGQNEQDEEGGGGGGAGQDEDLDQ